MEAINVSNEPLADMMVDVLGVRFHRVRAIEAVEKILHWTMDGTHHMVVTAGPEFVMQCQTDKSLLTLVNSADLVTADGVGVVWACAQKGRAVPERVTGVELATQVLTEAEARKQHLRVFLLGATDASLEACLRTFQKRFPSLEFMGQNGYFDPSNMDAIVGEIRAFQPHLFLVGMGQPKQEKLIRETLGRLEPCVGMGIGGSIDVWGGTVARAPQIVRKLNIEWLYRLVSQPKRWRRQLALPRFALSVLRSVRS